MKTKLFEKDEFETDFLQEFETKVCIHQTYLISSTGNTAVAYYRVHRGSTNRQIDPPGRQIT